MIRVLLARADGVDKAGLGRAIAAALGELGVADLPVHVDGVDRIPRTAAGKAPLVKRA